MWTARPILYSLLTELKDFNDVVSSIQVIASSITQSSESNSVKIVGTDHKLVRCYYI